MIDHNKINKKPAQPDPIMYRPTFPNDQWFVEEQRSHYNSSEITIVRQSKLHPLADWTKVYLVFVEFNMNACANEGRNFAFSARGGRNAKPNENVKRFSTFEGAKKYVEYMIDETEKFYSKIESQEAYDKYQVYLKDLKAKHNKDG